MPQEVYGTPTHFMPTEDSMTQAEIVLLVRALSQLGVCKVRLTGGEPLLRPDIESLIERLRNIPGIDDIALTTNGSLLTRTRAANLKAAGLNRVTVSIDSLDPERFGRVNGVGFPPHRILQAIDYAAASGLRPVKVNVVIKRGLNDQDIVPLAEYFRFSGHVVRYIEYMDVGTSNGWSRHDVVSAAEILQRLSEKWPLHPVE